MAIRIGKMTIELSSSPVMISAASIAGKIEGQGPLANSFDVVLEDELWDEKSWEKMECKMFREAVKIALRKTDKTEQDMECLLGGDLLNQIISAGFAARELEIPFLGLYAACATFSESIALAALLIESGAIRAAACASTSHFDTAERQYRYPLELGSQRTSTAQRTVTGAGAVVMAAAGNGPCVKRIVIGKVTDWKIKDANNMGAAMAPAAADTIAAYMKDTGETMQNFDAVITGDLGRFGTEMLLDILKDMGQDIAGIHLDCGDMIYPHEPGFAMGGSGCGCAASVFCGYIYNKLRARELNRILFLPTGALFSLTSTLQGETIPAIAHALLIENGKGSS